MKTYLLIFICAFILEILSTLYIQAVAVGNTPASVFLAFVGPLANLPFYGLIADAKTWPERVRIALIYGLGYAAGSLFVMLIKLF
jgi:hypothetical protein